MGDWERVRRREKEVLLLCLVANGLEVERGGEKLNVFSSVEEEEEVVVVVQTFSMLASGEDLVGAVGVGGGGIKFALREVRSGEGV